MLGFWFLCWLVVIATIGVRHWATREPKVPEPEPEVVEVEPTRMELVRRAREEYEEAIMAVGELNTPDDRWEQLLLKDVEDRYARRLRELLG